MPTGFRLPGAYQATPPKPITTQPPINLADLSERSIKSLKSHHGISLCTCFLISHRYRSTCHSVKRCSRIRCKIIRANSDLLIYTGSRGKGCHLKMKPPKRNTNCSAANLESRIDISFPTAQRLIRIGYNFFHIIY